MHCQALSLLLQEISPQRLIQVALIKCFRNADVSEMQMRFKNAQPAKAVNPCIVVCFWMDLDFELPVQSALSYCKVQGNTEKLQKLCTTSLISAGKSGKRPSFVFLLWPVTCTCRGYATCASFAATQLSSKAAKSHDVMRSNEESFSIVWDTR